MAGLSKDTLAAGCMIPSTVGAAAPAIRQSLVEHVHPRRHGTCVQVDKTPRADAGCRMLIQTGCS
ncbi:unnamed protein product [Mycena citricolor]|uniref:Uncharacterized protein n=1 Tax=Mycena citricolor TaxID=2018698 RepID=A0AAD2HN75_9AGAR|nr:unnamed protein product [Mycena citricolor]